MTHEDQKHQTEGDLADPSYGASQHYQGTLGEQYFSWQGPPAEVGARLNLRKFAPYIKPADIVLDFGCGGGALLAHIRCARRLGVEVNPTARAATQERGIDCVADLVEIADNSTDVVITNHVLEHIPYPIEALRQMRQKLRPGGTLVVCVPADDWRTQKRFFTEDRNHHLHTWTPLLLGNSLSEAGFTVQPEEIRMVTHAWPPFFGRLCQILPQWAFDLLATVWSVLMRKRQIIAVAHAE